MEEKIYVTKAGYDRMVEELRRLKTIERPKVVQEIANARAHGDIAENAEFQYAKERQSFLETRIQQLETSLAYAEVVDVASIKSDKVVFGARVLLENMEDGQQILYQIVGAPEADLEQGKVSINSPIARAMIGKRIDDLVQFNAPSGVKKFTILEITYE